MTDMRKDRGWPIDRWQVKSARYMGINGWYAYRAGQFDTTAMHFIYHQAAVRYANASAWYDRRGVGAA